LLKSSMIGDHLRLDMLQKGPRQGRRNPMGFGLGFDARQLGGLPSRIAKGQLPLRLQSAHLLRNLEALGEHGKPRPIQGIQARPKRRQLIPRRLSHGRSPAVPEGPK